MSFAEFEITVWNQPHRGYGVIAEIDSWLVDDGMGGGLQSFEDVKTSHRSPELMRDSPYKQFPVSPEQLKLLIGQANAINFSFAAHNATPMLGGTRFGIRIVQAMQEVMVTWEGRFEDQGVTIRELYSAVLALAYAQPGIPSDASGAPEF